MYSRQFPYGVGIDNRMPDVTILKDLSYFHHIHYSLAMNTPVAKTFNIIFGQHLIKLIMASQSWSSPVPTTFHFSLLVFKHDLFR